MKKRFLPVNHNRLLYNQFQHCKQGMHSVDYYLEEFHRLSARNNLAESDNQQVARYVDGLW